MSACHYDSSPRRRWSRLTMGCAVAEDDSISFRHSQVRPNAYCPPRLHRNDEPWARHNIDRFGGFCEQEAMTTQIPPITGLITDVM